MPESTGYHSIEETPPACALADVHEAVTGVEDEEDEAADVDVERSKTSIEPETAPIANKLSFEGAADMEKIPRARSPLLIVEEEGPFPAIILHPIVSRTSPCRNRFAKYRTGPPLRIAIATEMLHDRGTSTRGGGSSMCCARARACVYY